MGQQYIDISELCLDQEEIYMYISTALICAYIQEQGCDFIMLHHSSQFEIAILSHTSLVEGIGEGF